MVVGMWNSHVLLPIRKLNMHISYDSKIQLLGTHPRNNSHTGPQGFQIGMSVEEFSVPAGMWRYHEYQLTRKETHKME